MRRCCCTKCAPGAVVIRPVQSCVAPLATATRSCVLLPNEVFNHLLVFAKIEKWIWCLYIWNFALLNIVICRCSLFKFKPNGIPVNLKFHAPSLGFESRRSLLFDKSKPETCRMLTSLTENTKFFAFSYKKPVITDGLSKSPSCKLWCYAAMLHDVKRCTPRRYGHKNFHKFSEG